MHNNALSYDEYWWLENGKNWILHDSFDNMYMDMRIERWVIDFLQFLINHLIF